MATTFSIGVLVSGAVTSTFLSTMTGTQRMLDKLGRATSGLQQRQDGLTRALERYGDAGGRMAARLRSELDSVGRSFDRLEKRQKSLTKWAAQSQALKNNRLGHYGQLMETYGQARALYNMVAPALSQSMQFKSGMIDMAITAGYDDKTRDTLGQQIRGWSLQYNQLQDELQKAAGTLISNNIDSLSDIRAYMPAIARGATATNTPAELWAQAAFTTQQSLGLKASDFSAAQNIMTYAGKEGSFEIPDQVKWLPQLAPMMSGIAEGKEAVAELGAALQVARIGAGSSDEAANNFKNFLTKIFAQDNQLRFQNAGIDLKSSILQQKANGISPIEGMMNTIQWYIEKQSPEALKQFRSAMKIKDDKKRDEALKSLAANFQLGDLFSDMQVMAFVRPMLANMDKYRQIKDDSLKSADKDMLKGDNAKRLKDPLVIMRGFQVSANELAMSIGDQLTPSFAALTQEAVRWMNQASIWVKAHPQIVRNIAAVAASLLVFKGGMVIARLGLNIVLSPLVSFITIVQRARAAWMLFHKAIGSGGMLRRIASTAWSLARVLSTGLYKGIMIAARAILFMGRAMLMNPIGLIITGIAVGTYLIYRYWGPISAWFKARWNDIKTAFSGGIGGVSALILNWSPLGLFYKVFAGVMKWFGVDLPANFTDFGKNIINGLVSGIKNTWEETKNTVSDLADGVKNWFKDKLDIHSPSRVFMGYGDNIVQGLTIGINRSAPGAGKAVDGLGNSLRPRLPSLPAVPDLPQGFGSRTGGGIHITYTPKIYIDGQSQQPAGAIQEALTLSRQELERMLRDIIWQEQRRAY
ncbi:phage tail tape measure protein [Salmonella enterica]|nr:phage tail tape measure protein [Salmonella enterica]EBZ5137691.1 phage tail tape measure protein [Salmonella enterica subsp. enterica serovar Antsalova]EAP7475641.1 phage tail tape measure protein [Salmonella enterica]EDS3700314.1 phage tail tape measure protein [Salmonella enterica]EHA5320737.1 phage tail tape measure protein [Salmonella enterica]